MAKKYGVGILGAGWVAGEYVKAFRDHPLTEVVGVYNRTPGKTGIDSFSYRVDDSGGAQGGLGNVTIYPHSG